MAAIRAGQCWDSLGRVSDGSRRLLCELRGGLKAFSAEHGGITCPFSNARAVIEWSWAARRKFYFFPTNIWDAIREWAVRREDMIVWDPFMRRAYDGHERARLGKAIAACIKCFNRRIRLFPKAVPGREGHCTSGVPRDVVNKKRFRRFD